MGKIALVTSRDLREILQSKGTYWGLMVLPLIFVPTIVVFGEGIEWIGEELTIGGYTEEEARLESEALLIKMTIMLSFVSMMTFCLFFSGYSVLSEKLKCSLESLMATPLTVQQIWLGKALAVFLPSALLGIGLSAAAIVAANELFIVSAIGCFIALPAASLIVCIVSIPAIVLSLVCVTTLLQLIVANARVVNVLFFLFIFGVAFGIMSVPVDVASLDFTLVSIAFIAVLAIFILLLARLLTKERVVLSSKG